MGPSPEIPKSTVSPWWVGGAGLQFVPLGVRSFYSFLDSTMSPERLVARAVECGYGAVGVADTNNLSGAVVFYKAARDAGIHPVLGVEITQPLAHERRVLWQRGGEMGSSRSGGGSNGRGVGRGAGAEEGTEFFGESWDEAWMDSGDGDIWGWAGEGRAVQFGSGEMARGVRGRSAGSGSRSQSPMLGTGNRSERVFLFALNLRGYAALCEVSSRRMTDGNFELWDLLSGLSPDVVVASDCPAVLSRGLRCGLGESPASDGGPRLLGLVLPGRRYHRRNSAVMDWVRDHGEVPLMAGCHAPIATAREAPLHDVLQAMRRLAKVDEIPLGDRVGADECLAGPEAILEALQCPRPDGSGLGDEALWRGAMSQAGELAARCQVELPLHQWKFPRFGEPGEDPVRKLRDMVDRGLGQRYGSPVPEASRQRADYELGVIEKLGFTEYFLLVERIVSEGHSRGFFTVGRGSGANSIISYVLRFTDVCPIRYGLYFERFLNPDRSVPPDIDIDFSWRDRDEVLQWCFDFFGSDRVALIATVQTLQRRQAIREVARAMGISPAEITRFTRLSSVGFVVEREGEYRCLAHEEPWSRVLELSAQVVDFPRHLSIHCGGILITPGPVCEWVPLARSAKGFLITQMDMYSVEELGLMKIDLLSNRSLGVLKDGLRMAGETLDHFREMAGDGSQDPGWDSTPGDQARRGGFFGGSGEEKSAAGAVFQREAQRMKLEGSRRGTSVALAGVLGMVSGEGRGPEDCPSGQISGEEVTDPSCGSDLRQCVLDFQFITRDAATRSVIDMGRTIGCFYIESPGMRALFERLRCQSFEEVVAASSIIRPGVAESGMMQEYIARHQRYGSGRVEDGPAEPEGEMVFLDRPGGSERLATGLMPLNAHAKSRTGRPHGVVGSPSVFTRHAEVSAAGPVSSKKPMGPGGASSQAGHGHGPNPIHPRMLELLPETYGVMVYQEDVLCVAHDLAGMTYAEADTLRRAMSGKARSRDAMMALKERFILGAMERSGMPADDAEEVWRQMSSFAGYSFCKGHSAAFAVLSYQVTYLKTHFPAEFIASVVNNRGGFYGVAAYLEEGRRWGVTVQGPCVNASEEECFGRTDPHYSWWNLKRCLDPPVQPSRKTGAGLPDPRVRPVRPAAGTIRLGLNLLKGIRQVTRHHLLWERRERGEFTSIRDLLVRVPMRLEEALALADGGALDQLASRYLDPAEPHPLGGTPGAGQSGAVARLREELRQRIPLLPSPGREFPAGFACRPWIRSVLPKIFRELARGGERDLISPAPSMLGEDLHPDCSQPVNPVELAYREMAVMGLMTLSHPLQFARLPRRSGTVPLVPGLFIRQFAGRTVRMVGWLVAAKTLATKTNGKSMKMLTLEDCTDCFEAVLFPRIYERFAPRTLTHGPYLVEGEVDISLGSPTLNVEKLEILPIPGSTYQPSPAGQDRIC